ncbi:class I SAM-dependent methyltransferase [Blastopirellula marina]|uniref:Class I SAM-dependent methyltransferase n=1 Tax=Blastopirellula marina TaxID=124 RepID=A0A2S8FUF3_9BACT|nr:MULTISPECIES: class I SAM-dependent methyltransferase [Pirellulaceae]PQO35802.1 class I SAM-dependent methyltransferase [Blastopirellula marina]RCS53377.1 class I SAM-dependent methyltransferase [Bremerella cremea]
MSSSSSKPSWQLPTGVTRGSLDYIESAAIADGYDEDIAFGSDFQFDEQVVADFIPAIGLVADLGCGTARALIPLVRRGNQGLAVDLSEEMLRIVAEKAQQEGLDIQCLQANLVELEAIADQSIDHAICMFSTLGMIKGAAYRKQFLDHVHRILKPGGKFVVHVHNFWFNFFEPDGAIWLATHLVRAKFTRGMERGDKYYRYRGIPNFFLHVFSRSEFSNALKSSNFNVSRLVPLRMDRQAELSHPWFFGKWRASGWIALCEKPS